MNKLTTLLLAAGLLCAATSTQAAAPAQLTNLPTVYLYTDNNLTLSPSIPHPHINC